MPSEIQKLPLSKQIIYGVGLAGWTIFYGLISVMLLYIYLPPANSGMVDLIPQFTILFILNPIAVILGGGRLFDAISDPIIAVWSDKSKHPKGRRIPLMRLAIIPSLFFTIMVFAPIKPENSYLNIIWLSVSLLGFYLSLTLYNIPYNALLPELGHTSVDKLQLSIMQAIGLLVGFVVSSQAPALADYIENHFTLEKRIQSFEYAIWILSFIGAVFMALPAFLIDEKKYCKSIASAMPIGKALREALTNRDYVYFIVADFCYFLALAIIMNGLLYYVKVLLGLDESFGSDLIILLVVVSMTVFLVVKPLTKRFGKKKLILISFVVLGILMLGIFFLGKYPAPPIVQAYMIITATAIPMTFLMILPTAVLADLSELDGRKSGHRKEGMYFAVRNLVTKFGQTLALMLAAMLTLLGKDPGNDLGIRLYGIVGLVFCIIAAVIFMRFNEKRILSELAETEHLKIGD